MPPEHDLPPAEANHVQYGEKVRFLAEKLEHETV